MTTGGSLATPPKSPSFLPFVSVDWRGKYGWLVKEEGGWLVGTTSRLYALYGLAFLPIALIFATSRSAKPDASETVFHAIGGIASFALVLMAGSTNRVTVNLATGEVRTRRGLFGIGRSRRFVRPQIDGVFMTVHEDSRHPNQNYCAVGLQMGLLRYAMYRTMNGERAVAFYRDLKAATDFPGVAGV